MGPPGVTVLRHGCTNGLSIIFGFHHSDDPLKSLTDLYILKALKALVTGRFMRASL